MHNSFGISIIPDNDAFRLNALKKLQILDSGPELFFDNLVQIVARCFDMPVALISLVDKERVFFKSNVGMSDVRNVSRGISICSLAILSKEPTIIPDALQQPCLLSNPLVAGEYGLRFYAGAPIITEDGYVVGTVCVLDKKPRAFSSEDQELLTLFSKSVMKGLAERVKTITEPAFS